MNGHLHIADISNVLTPLIDKNSIRPALAAYGKKHGLRITTAREVQRRGFPTRKTRLDRTMHVSTTKTISEIIEKYKT